MSTEQKTVVEPRAQRGPTRAPRADIQFLRAVAVIAVIAFHAGVPFVTGGYVGVDVFFVISGFLISSHLVDRIQRYGSPRFADFYARRVRRILPASMLVLLTTAVALATVVPVLDRPLFNGPRTTSSPFEDLLATAFYVPNLWFAHQSTDYLADSAPSPVQHYWSLGVEEQFYLMWPLLLFAGWVAARKRLTGIVATIIAVAAASFALSLWLTDANQAWAFFSPATRAWEFAAGAAVALWTGRYAMRLAHARIMALAGIVLIGASCLWFGASTAFPGVAALAPVLGTVLVIAAGDEWHRRSRSLALIASRTTQRIGDWSYSLYLWHWPLLILPPIVLTSHHWTLALAGVASTFVLAALTYRYVEQPLRVRGARPALTLTAAAASTVAIAVAILALNVVSANRDFGSVGEGDRVIEAGRPVTATTTIASNLEPALGEVSGTGYGVHSRKCLDELPKVGAEKCYTGADGAKHRIALLGDSHAAQLMPGLNAASAALDTTVWQITEKGCPAFPIVREGREDRCATWREAAYAALAREPVDAIVIANRSYHPEHDTAATADEWAAATTELLDGLPADVPVIWIRDYPEFESGVHECAAVNPGDITPCLANLDDPLRDVVIRAATGSAADHGAHIVDLEPYLCVADMCSIVQGATLVFADEHHLTSTYSATLAGLLEREIEPHLSGGR